MTDATPTYHKIQSVFKRDPDNHYKTFLMWDWSEPEFSYLADNMWVATEKIDGTNTRIHVGTSGFCVGGRTDNAQLQVDLMNRLNDVGNRTAGLGLDGLTLYGEGYGAGIQKGGGGYRPDKGFILYDVMVTDTGMFLERENVFDIANKLGVGHVFVTAMMSLRDSVNWFSEGGPVPSFERVTDAEGWVLRPAVELRNRMGQRIITKLKVTDFPERNQRG